ncbi:hypothetical protein EPA93_43355 [Ktedonosporobacter rubrisoli]|uniref:Uncharacterized protein n=1 Tax=Ktedonosporobacter rubrisoli TaxID=2509675 RepID=A0A4P6K2T5_KTERU|nr:hypothetical protein [Ktedonosporobacter rubrisoli]QBD82454.1 hypothetical protein EPA93_43355 [Ktedonosporobacter rubrisoli]
MRTHIETLFVISCRDATKGGRLLTLHALNESEALRKAQERLKDDHHWQLERIEAYPFGFILQHASLPGSITVDEAGNVVSNQIYLNITADQEAPQEEKELEAITQATDTKLTAQAMMFLENKGCQITYFTDRIEIIFPDGTVRIPETGGSQFRLMFLDGETIIERVLSEPGKEEQSFLLIPKDKIQELDEEPQTQQNKFRQ